MKKYRLLKEMHELEEGELFTFIDISKPMKYQVFIKGEYDKKTNSYSFVRYSDNYKRKLRADKLVYTGVTF